MILYKRVNCPDCEWSQFQDGEVVGMTPCPRCESTGYLYEPVDIEEVKKILDKQYEEGCHHLNTWSAAYEICQTFEPEPDEAEGDVVTYTLSCDKCGELFCSPSPSPQLCPRCSKPEEGRLLTDGEMQTIRNELVRYINLDTPFGKVEVCRTIAKAQRDLTASIKDAECQERVERIFGDIEKIYGKLFGSNQVFIGIIPSEDWQALKKGVK